jgi:hypothetical protein
LLVGAHISLPPALHAFQSITAMQSRHRRRHRLTPIVDRRNEHVWSRALTTMGLQPLNSHTRPAASKGEEAAAPIHAPAPTAESSSTEGKKKTTTILDLPFETQKAIFQHASYPFPAAVSRRLANQNPNSLPRPIYSASPLYRSTFITSQQSISIGASTLSSPMTKHQIIANIAPTLWHLA